MSEPNNSRLERLCKDCNQPMPRAAGRHFCGTNHHCKRCDKPMPKRKPSGYCSFACFKPPAFYTCEHCSKEFRGKPGKPERFCSRQCYNENKAKRLVHVCKGCGNEFKRPNCVGKANLYCSRRCSAKTQTRNTRLSCSHCQRVFTRRPAFTKAEKPYCSLSCYYLSKDDRTEINCAQCHKVISATRFFREKRITKFCSKLCHRLFSGETSIEKAIREALENLSIDFIQEHPVQFSMKNKRCGSFYFLDFFLPKTKTAIEADGVYWHKAKKSRDEQRDAFLSSQGIAVIRITDEELKAATDVTALVYERLLASRRD